MNLRSHAKRERERDRISELPEPLIHHVFSFLPIKSIVSTSILSRTWRYLWTSIPIIDLRNQPLPAPNTFNHQPEVNSFMRFVDRVLSFRQDVHSPSIKEFGLYLDTAFDASRVNGWISTVLRHKVEALALEDRKGITFPPSLFTCESLTYLEIEKSTLELPESVNFPKLRTLHLDVGLENEHLIQKLLSNSPILEELSLELCDWDIRYLRIFGPNLKRLFINGYCSHRNFDIQINAPNLQSFEYSGILAKDFVLHNFLTLLDAEVELSRLADSGERGELGCRASKLVSSLSNAKNLRVSDFTLKLLSYQHNFPMELPLFYNLIHLEVSRWHPGELFRWVVRRLLGFLQVSPNLQSLIFVVGFYNYDFDDDDRWSLDSIPQCLLVHLKSIEFRGCFWNQVTKDLVKWFLKNAKVLQRLRITVSNRSIYLKNLNHRKEVLDEISLFPRSSADCVLHVS
ncbi:hypothetical protein MKW92_007740 [Papaver armeniacum]|nr:hypothetical protein MKW92_007740 [Papaver armeniacum]